MTTVIAPSLGHGAPFTQLGVGTSPGFDAIDLRRVDTVGLAEAPLSLSSYTVAQRGAGANMSIDVAASSGPGLIVNSDVIANGGRYVVPPHSATINEVIAAADPTNPRIDSIILEVKDSTHDASGLNQSQTRVLTGTPTPGATSENGTGAAALPNSAILLAYVQVDAAAGSIVTAKCKDMRPKRRGKVNTAASESTTATTYAYNNLATPDRVTQIVLPTDALIAVLFQGIWQNTVANNARVAVFLNAVQHKIAIGTGAATLQEGQGPTELNDDSAFATNGLNFTTVSGVGASTEVTTGQIVGTSGNAGSGAIYIFAAAGTYDVSVQFKNNAAGTLTVKNRHLWVEVRDYDQCQFT